MTTLAERLKRAREEEGLSQVALAKKAGVATGTIGNLEAGTRRTARNLLGIAAALNRRPQWLADGIGPERDDQLQRGYQWPFESIQPSAWAALSERQKGAAEAAAIEAIARFGPLRKQPRRA